MTEMRKVKHGPFRGYVSSVGRDLIPPDAAGPDSRDWRYNPTLGKWIERAGSAILGDTLPSPVGLTETQQSYRTRQVFEFPSVKDQNGSAQFSDGFPSYAALYDNNTLGATGAGTIYIRSSNSGGSNQTPGKSMVSTEMAAGTSLVYPTTNRNGLKSFAKAPICWHQFGATEQISHRLGDGLTTFRRRLYSGARKVLIVGNWLYAQGLFHDPRRWNMLLNESASSPGRKERHWPIGILPVLFPAWIKAADFPTPNQPNDTWTEGDSFWMSALYVFEDGTWGPPFIPRALYGTQVAGGYNDNYGYVKLSSGNPGRTWRYIPWRNIAQPPPGCTHTVLLRSTKVAAASGAVPPLTDPDGNLDLRVIALIPRGQTSYNDYSGSDTALLVDIERVRSDHISPPRARYIGSFDGRVCVGYTLPSPQCIYLAHTGTTNPNDNTDDDDATLGTVAYATRRTGNDLQLRKIDGGAGFPAAPTQATFSLLTGTPSLQDLVDSINGTTVSSTTGEWRAQLAPGVDGGLQALSVGHSVTVNNGDDALVNDATTGNQQAYAQGYPAVIHFTQGAINTLQVQPDREGFWFTRSAPESAAVGVTSAPNLWVAGNYRRPPEHSGILMGFAPLENGMVVFYSEKVWLFRNTRDFRTGRDEDYYFALLSNDGCIAWDSIVAFNNAVGWLSKKGYKVTAGVPGDERLISLAIYDPTENTGDLAYEIGKCVASAAADTDDMRFHAYRFGHVLTIKYRSSASATVPDFEQEYDFSEGSQSGGLTELFRPDGSEFGWSAPFRRPGEAMGQFRNANGVIKLHSIETTGSTGEGRIDQLDTGHQDNSTAIATVLHTRTDDQGEIARRKRERRFALKYKSPTGHTMTVTHYRDRGRLSSTTYTMQNTTTAALAVQTKRIKLDGQSPARVSEYKIGGTRVSAGAAEVWEMEREVKVLDTPLETAG